MADETTQDTNTETNVPEFTEVEQTALEQGWVPKEDFTGDEHKWVEAGEFLRRGELFQKIDSQNRRIKDQEKVLNDLKGHYEKVRETEYKRALAELRKEKKEALLEGDADAVLEVDEKIEDLRNEQETERLKAAQQEVREGPHPQFAAWVEKNTWYSSNPAMRGAADALGRELASQGFSPPEVLEKVTKAIREEFPHKFQNPKRTATGSVEGGGRPTGGSRSQDKVELTDLERKIMNNLVRSGTITEEQYKADIKALRERS